MAFLTGNVYSKALGMDTNLTVVSPRKSTNYDSRPYRTVTLLHGLSDGSASWASNTPLGLLADQYGIVFLLPEVQRSFYIDMAYGPAYFTYVCDELPRLCRNLFRLSDRREDSFIFGLSMGGYGALKCALSRPEQYAGCGAFSACCDLRGALEQPFSGEFLREARAVLGMKLELLDENDLFLLVRKAALSPVLPRLYMTCGTEDFLYQMNIRWKEQMQDLPAFDFSFEAWSGGHTWSFWEKSLQLAMRHFFGEPK